jgi:hypothetical protein
MAVISFIVQAPVGGPIICFSKVTHTLSLTHFGSAITLSARTISITTLRIVTLSIKGLFVTFRINDNQDK